MIRRKTKHLCLAAAALTLTMGVSVGSAMAYFTTYASASGGASLSLSNTVTIPEEQVIDWTKHVTIANTGNQDCYVRVKAFAGSAYTFIRKTTSMITNAIRCTTRAMAACFAGLVI